MFSPYRETANITDGSKFCAGRKKFLNLTKNIYFSCLHACLDMAVQTVIGDSFHGATWVALHNGGGVGWYENHTVDTINSNTSTAEIQTSRQAGTPDR